MPPEQPANADQSDLYGVYGTAESLPDPLPASPLGLLGAWYADAHGRGVQPNPNAMTLATIDPDGLPSARIVLCKDLDTDVGRLTFYTNYQGRKGRALAANPVAAVVFHWDALDRQIRLEGPVTRSPDAESDAYFASRPWESKLGAWASDPTEPIASRDALLSKVDAAAEKLGLDTSALTPGDRAVPVPRPPHWGGWRLWISRAEFWVGGTGRVHDRAVWTRTIRLGAIDPALETRPEAFSDWSRTRLQP